MNNNSNISINSIPSLIKFQSSDNNFKGIRNNLIIHSNTLLKRKKYHTISTKVPFLPSSYGISNVSSYSISDRKSCERFVELGSLGCELSETFLPWHRQHNRGDIHIFLKNIRQTILEHSGSGFKNGSSWKICKKIKKGRRRGLYWITIDWTW